jgi:hypothetical protein
VIESKRAVGATTGLDFFLSRLAHGPRGSANLDHTTLQDVPAIAVLGVGFSRIVDFRSPSDLVLGRKVA